MQIFPPYYLFLLLALWILHPLFSSNPAFRALSEQQRWYWLYLQNWHIALHGWPGFGFDHFWSLAVEEQFYLVWPLLVFLAGRAGR